MVTFFADTIQKHANEHIKTKASDYNYNFYYVEFKHSYICTYPTDIYASH